MSTEKLLTAFARNEAGAVAIEYALIASLIAIAIVGGLTSLGTRISGVFSEVSGALK
jgi:pilus assembly protein Flp/PilA